MAKEMSLGSQFHDHIIAVERRSRLTAETYRLEIDHYLLWLEKRGKGAEEADSRDLREYLEYRHGEEKLTAATVAKAISVLRSFYRFLGDTGRGQGNPAQILEVPKNGFRIPEVYPRFMVEEMLKSIDTATDLGLRDRAIFELIYSTGMRISEAASLNLRDLSFGEMIIRVTGKGNKERLVVFGNEAKTWLKRYLNEARPQLLKGRKSSALFVGRTGRRLSRKGIWKNYASHTTSAGISSRVHNLRHSFATEMLSGGADLRSVQELLGHADLATTQIYTHVNNSMLRESHRRYLPDLKKYQEEEKRGKGR